MISHVNAYILEDGDGLTIVDTGLYCQSCKVIWKKIINSHFKDIRIRRVILTHHHPDHFGLAGWFVENFGSEVWSTNTAWLTARMMTLDNKDKVSDESLYFWHSAGASNDFLKKKRKEKPFNFSDFVAPIPLGYRRVTDNEVIEIGNRAWRVILGNGHAPDHIMLFSAELKIFISGDQVLPVISPNLSVYPTEPLANPVGDFIKTCENLLALRDLDYLVLPGHNLPFKGLSPRLTQVIEHHVSATERINHFLESKPRTAVEIFPVLYKRRIKETEFLLALGEAVGHLNYLWLVGQISRNVGENGVVYYHKKI